MIEKPYSYTLNDIASWQLEHEKSNVELPALQRGFVWKVNQIESLWDSLLRGFPIGSFLLSKSEDDKLFLLDGQQRATSIAIGHYDPWQMADSLNSKFWSLKNIPIVWIDMKPKDKTNTHKFVTRVVTQSHPWGYQRINHNSILSVSDRRNALNMFRNNPGNKTVGYIQLSPLNIYPYDSDLPVPLSFLLNSISDNDKKWKENLISLCVEYLPVKFIQTKHNSEDYISQLSDYLFNEQFDNSIFNAVRNLKHIEIPGIVVRKEILKAEDEQTGEDPTLFVRLNSSGTRIAGEELIYSIYKASFPEAKQLVETIGANFAAPSLVISLVARLAFSNLNEGAYPAPINVNDFRKRIQDEKFKNCLRELIGDENYSPSAIIFSKAFNILLSDNQFNIPPVLVKSIVKNSPDLFLMLLQWINLNKMDLSADSQKAILGTITSLAWFGRDNTKFVREIWKNIHLVNFWSKEILSTPFKYKKDFIMYPLIQPIVLRDYLIKGVVEDNIKWDNLYPTLESPISTQYRKIFSPELEQESEITNAIRGIWDNFMNKIFWNKSFVLFAQRKYINDSFGDFNHMETLEDTNTPWDWDHIYPDSWVSGRWYINQNTRHWTKAIGNFRALSLEQNRSENNSLSPKERLEKVQNESFIKRDDWEFWSKITGRINDGNDAMIKNHLTAIILRLCNIYDEWYSTLNIGELFNFEIDPA